MTRHAKKSVASEGELSAVSVQCVGVKLFLLVSVNEGEVRAFDMLGTWYLKRIQDDLSARVVGDQDLKALVKNGAVALNFAGSEAANPLTTCTVLNAVTSANTAFPTAGVSDCVAIVCENNYDLADGKCVVATSDDRALEGGEIAGITIGAVVLAGVGALTANLLVNGDAAAKVNNEPIDALDGGDAGQL